MFGTNYEILTAESTFGLYYLLLKLEEVFKVNSLDSDKDLFPNSLFPFPHSLRQSLCEIRNLE